VGGSGQKIGQTIDVLVNVDFCAAAAKGISIVRGLGGEMEVGNWMLCWKSVSAGSRGGWNVFRPAKQLKAEHMKTAENGFVLRRTRRVKRIGSVTDLERSKACHARQNP